MKFVMSGAIVLHLFVEAVDLEAAVVFWTRSWRTDL